MNERIRELAEQAIEHDYTTWDSYNQKELVYTKFNQEKFAELIVRECSDFVYGYPHKILTRNQLSEICQAMEQHFGVE